MKWTLAYASIFLIFMMNVATAFNRGIYLTQSTAQDKSTLIYLIQQAKKFGIDTFVIDINQPSKSYANNVKMVLQNHIHYVARLVIFPHGGTHAQVQDKRIWIKRLALAQYAAKLGANAIQLDYIRYRAENPSSPEKAKQITKVVKYFQDNLKSYPVSLQMDIFGVVAHSPSHTIGQDVRALAPFLDAFCPMVYPSHYEPFRYHAIRPYETIFNSIMALKKQLGQNSRVAIYAYIELFNYRFPLSATVRSQYIAAQIKAARDSGANGWYAWSPRNHYGKLFEVLAA